MKPTELEQIGVTLGWGENHFTMSRGSFTYRRKESKKYPLSFAGKEEIDSGFRYSYQGSSGIRCTLDVVAFGDGYKITVSDYPEESVNRFQITLPSHISEKFYGCGEVYSTLNLKGEKVRIWVAEHQNTNRISRKIVREGIFGKQPNHILPMDQYESYYAQPTFISDDLYYVHADVTSYSVFDFTKDQKTVLQFDEAPTIYIEWGESFEDVSEKLSNLLGRPKDLPSWVNDGVILAVQESTDRVEEKIRRAEKAGVKLCGIWSQDWCGCRRTGFGYQVMWNWKWDEALYPGLDEKIPAWKEKGIHFLGYINPFMALEGALYKEASAEGYCVKDTEGNDYLVKITTFPAAMIDLTNPNAYAWYKNVIKTNMIGLGLGGWMADFGEYLPVDCVLHSGEDPYKIHNIWPAMWARLNRETIEETGKVGEVFFFTRAGYTGTIKDSMMMWTGDQHVDWSLDDGLAAVMPATLSLAMSGYPYAHSDAGGYTTILKMTRNKELLMRWEEMNAFSPMFRTHEGNQPVNNVQFDDDEELLAQMARCSQMHLHLKPYLAEAIALAQEKGTPVMRPLFYHYKDAFCFEERFAYLLGRDLLVSPVIKEGELYHDVRLPEDTWVHLFTGTEYTGGTYKVFAPIGKPPVFVRKDSPWLSDLLALPFANEKQ